MNTNNMGHFQDKDGRKCPAAKWVYFRFSRKRHVTFCHNSKPDDKKCYNALTCTLRKVLSEEEIGSSGIIVERQERR
jgi:hypothetical protein